jgi:uncharacterized protein (TIGR04255 family)
MTQLSKAPLVEAIFELRWDLAGTDNGQLLVPTPSEEAEFFVGQFHGVAKLEGFSEVERLNPNLQIQIPHVISHRFRRSPNTWPCYQIGLGIFTVNQINEGYAWSSFKTNIAKGLELLNSGHPSTLASLPLVGVDLTYQDGMIFEPGESASDFLKKKLNFGYEPPKDLISEVSDGGVAQGYSIGFQIPIKKPAGLLIVELQEALINGILGFAMNTRIRSINLNVPTATQDGIIAWLEEAHKIQKIAFDKLINPTFAKSFN